MVHWWRQRWDVYGVGMQVQLIVANEQRNGQVIPVNVPSFMIGRAEGCNLCSRSPQVSRFHCTITVNNDTVMIQDLGGENGTFVNGNRVATVQTLKDGDKLVIGTHSFVVSIKAGAGKPHSGSPTDKDNFFELASSSGSIAKSDQSDTAHSADLPTKAAIKEKAKKSEQEPEIMFEIRLDGQRISVTKSRLFDLARRGSVLPDDLVTVAGTKVFADSIQGIVFGNQASAPPPRPVTSPPSSVVQTPAVPKTPTAPVATTPAAPESDPFAFHDVEGAHGESNPFDHSVAEPFVRVARRESAFGAVWNALDISFSRVYTMEGNNLVIHSLKALYYVVVVISLLVVFFMWLDVGRKCYEAYVAADNALNVALNVFSINFVGLAVVTFGCITIIVIVRVLLEMLLLYWIESSKAEQEGNDENRKG